VIYPHPKPPKTVKQPRKRIRPRRRPRKGRLKGDDLARLRTNCFERDNWRCVLCGSRDDLEMAHIKAKRIGLDILSNVQTECAQCHRAFHQFGPTRVKPCKPKHLQ
jgi:5-methylcytosine-specific restriction endonuclease McrA